MVRRFIVNVNGTAYDVEVEEVGGVAGRPRCLCGSLSFI